MSSASSKVVLEAGSRFDAYELLGLLARGGMANVWLARQRMKHGLETLVAIKTILPEFSLDPQFQTMFLDEARIACRIDHPHVARLLDVGDAFGHSYIVMEYVGGESLSRLRRTYAKNGTKVPLEIALRVLADLCSGLHAAHELRDADGNDLCVVHRDVSPQNVLLSDSGVVKLIDFGVAKARGRLGGETSAGFAKGKARYMAPEQAAGEPLDRRADVWAVGAMLYELLTGRTPLDGDNDMVVFKKLIGDATFEPLPNDIAAPIRDITYRALRREPRGRFDSAAKMRDAIEDAMVTLSLRATATQIEQACGKLLAERIEERKAFITLSLKAADDRSGIRNVIASMPAVDDSRSSLPLGKAIEPTIPVVVADDKSVMSVTHEETPVKQSGVSRVWLGAVVGTLVVTVALVAFLLPRLSTHATASQSTETAPPRATTTEPTTSAAPPVTTSPIVATITPSASAQPTAHVRVPVNKPTARPRPSATAHNWGGIE